MQASLKKITLSALLLLGVVAVEPNPPTWDLNKVKIFTPGRPGSQEILNQIFRTQGGQ